MRDIIKALYDIQAIKIGKFTLKSGDISPIYIDLRIIPSYPDVFKKVISVYTRMVKQVQSVDAVAGIMSAGVPFATGICLELNLPLLQIRSEAKSHGTKKMIEGVINATARIVLIDDLISTGASKTKPIEELRKNELVVKDLIVLIDRTNKQSRDVLHNSGVSLHAAFTLHDIYTTLQAMEIEPRDLEIIAQAIDTWEDN
ncbi:MAG: orotate phosphoribosyltransferase [Candidatus Heimdallarchaeota archaeon]|nr:orotate phosphoribosyltransferase [Candidatus Heimdallarchaeota archaeon]